MKKIKIKENEKVLSSCSILQAIEPFDPMFCLYVNTWTKCLNPYSLKNSNAHQGNHP